MSAKCDYLLHGYFGYIAGSSVGPDGGLQSEHPECMLRENHEGSHLAQFSDGVVIEWEPDNSGACGCTSQEQEDGECDCFAYHEVTTKNAIERLQKDGPRT